ncbi:MAG TPA: four helix bundle protein, partial [Gemmatimonadaceae bacterium]|nr:four helix bundle protein [Gemmatimonadaceae bacterium]
MTLLRSAEHIVPLPKPIGAMPSSANDLHERLITFAVAAVEVVRRIPRDIGGQNVARQLAKCSSSPAAHYAEARGAESTHDYIHKMRMALKELRETDTWLRIAEAISAG